MQTLVKLAVAVAFAFTWVASAIAEDKPMDHSKMDHSKMDHGAPVKPDKVVPPKEKPASAAAKKPKTSARAS